MLLSLHQGKQGKCPLTEITTELEEVHEGTKILLQLFVTHQQHNVLGNIFENI